MPRRVQNAQQNFAAGVLSPRYSAAIESEAFNRGLQKGSNFLISSQGGAVFREGFQYIKDAVANQPFRVFQFRRGGDQSDILLEVAEGTIRYWWDIDGVIQPIVDLTTLLTDEDTGPPQDFLVDETGAFLSLGQITSANPYEGEDMDTLYFTNQDTYGIICTQRHPPLYITTRADGSIIAELLAKYRIPIFTYNDLNSPRVSAFEADWRVTFPESWSAYQLYYHVTYKDVLATGTYAFDPTDGTVQKASIEAALANSAAKQGFTTTFVVTVIDAATPYLTYDIAVDGDNSGWDVTIFPVYGNVWVPISLAPISQAVVGESGEPAWSYPGMVFQPDDDHYYQCIQTHVSDADSEPGNPSSLATSVWEIYWTDLGIPVPDGWDYQYPTGNEWATATIYSPLNRGFPTVAVFHEQRLILMANPCLLYTSPSPRDRS